MLYYKRSNFIKNFTPTHVNNFKILFLDNAYDFIDQLSEPDKAKILANIKIMETDLGVVRIKLLGNHIRELIVKKYRLLFFIKNNTIFFIDGFIKKSQKTPKREIEKAENIYKSMK